MLTDIMTPLQERRNIWDNSLFDTPMVVEIKEPERHFEFVINTRAPCEGKS